MNLLPARVFVLSRSLSLSRSLEARMQNRNINPKETIGYSRERVVGLGNYLPFLESRSISRSRCVLRRGFILTYARIRKEEHVGQPPVGRGRGKMT